MSYPEFEDYKANASKEPVGDNAKKEFWVGCHTKEDWEFIHEELKKDGSLEDNIPTDSCNCCNECKQSDVRALYMLSENESASLRNHPKVKYVHINSMAYPGTYADDPDTIVESQPSSKTARYSSTVKHKRDISGPGTYLGNDPTADKLNRGGYQLLRHTQKVDPWYGSDDHTIFDSNIEQYATGKDVDVIVLDTDMWFGHIEFQNPAMISNIKQSDGSTAATTVAPNNYIGTNVLKSGFSASATTGCCELLDILLEGPYYIDPAWFEADASNRLELRWDGTTVPKQSVAKEWWSDGSKRSNVYANIGTISSSAMSSYTRARCNGTNTSRNSGGGTHGTPCASQAYGRQYGWSYNANKWFINIIGSGAIGYENTYDMLRLFHLYKPNRTSDNTKNPTITSNSWGLRMSNISSGYYYYRVGTSGSGGIYYSGSTERPSFMDYYTGDGFQNRSPEYVESSHSSFDAGREMTEAGVIWVCSAGNNNQKMVKSDHPDYNNYVSSSDNTSYENSKRGQNYSSMSGSQVYQSQNRAGYPAQLGVDKSTTPYTYPVIQIGALDDDHHSSGKERKVYYSNMGNAVACFAAADDTLAANRYSSGYERYDAFYTYNSQQSYESEDTDFGGTSSACPCAVGVLASKLEYNRTWTHADLKSWLASLGDIDSTYFYHGTETTSATDATNWGDSANMHGGPITVIYDAITTGTGSGATRFTFNGPLNISGKINLTT